MTTSRNVKEGKNRFHFFLFFDARKQKEENKFAMDDETGAPRRPGRRVTPGLCSPATLAPPQYTAMCPFLCVPEDSSLAACYAACCALPPGRFVHGTADLIFLVAPADLRDCSLPRKHARHVLMSAHPFPSFVRPPSSACARGAGCALPDGM